MPRIFDELKVTNRILVKYTLYNIFPETWNYKLVYPHAYTNHFEFLQEASNICYFEVNLNAVLNLENGGPIILVPNVNTETV